MTDAQCPICDGEREQVFSALVLGRHDAEYLKCWWCGFLGPRSPQWLPEAYQSAIAEVDTGVLTRARTLEPRLTCILRLAFSKNAVFGDFGAGYGVLVRNMRDVGFDFRWSDPYCDNLLARGFEFDGEVCAAVTAVEVLEHAQDPLAFLRKALDLTRAAVIILTTELLPEPVPDLDWWYYAFPTGQHIAFFERRTLVAVAERLGLHLRSRHNLHVLHSGRVKPWHFTVAATRLAPPVAWALRRSLRSRTDSDNPLLGNGPRAD
ncbi:MAG: class I SAM-dependent methyltransferase [Acidimicrobiales bacterium]